MGINIEHKPRVNALRHLKRQNTREREKKTRYTRDLKTSSKQKLFNLQAMESDGSKELETAEEIQERRQKVLTRYQRFKERVAERGQKLEDSYHYQVFIRDADDHEKWITEKMKIASDKSYEDPTNIQVLQFH